MNPTRDELLRALDRLADEDRLRCVVDGEKSQDGKPAKLCPAFISNHERMCAGCAANWHRSLAGARPAETES